MNTSTQEDDLVKLFKEIPSELRFPSLGGNDETEKLSFGEAYSQYGNSPEFSLFDYD